MNLQIDTSRPREGLAVVTVEGELDVHSSPQLKKTIVDLLCDGAPQVVIDLNGVDYLDSTGLGALLGGMRRATESGGNLCVVCTNSRILRIFEVTGLARLFRICTTEAEALDGSST